MVACFDMILYFFNKKFNNIQFQDGAGWAQTLYYRYICR
jgi:hypothetical protein